MAVTDRIPEPNEVEGRAERLEASRARVRQLLQDPQFADQAREAIARRQDAGDGVVERARTAELAEAAFRQGYGDAFVEDLKSRYGG